VVFGENGEIIGASKIWREIESDKEMKIITPEEAFDKFKQRWPGEAKPGQLERAKIRTEVSIKEVYVTYYAKPGCVPQDYIEPVYVFKGDYQTSSKIGERDTVYPVRTQTWVHLVFWHCNKTASWIMRH
ncbi:unnamed protein product, partial [marine sediment metagenome]